MHFCAVQGKSSPVNLRDDLMYCAGHNTSNRGHFVNDGVRLRLIQSDAVGCVDDSSIQKVTSISEGQVHDGVIRNQASSGMSVAATGNSVISIKYKDLL